METFNINEAGKELETALKQKFGSGSPVSLTIDIQIPEFVAGDRQGFFNSIIQICTCLNKHIADLNIDIKLSRIEQYSSEVKLSVDVRGSHHDGQVILSFINMRHNHIRRLVKSLPYSTLFSHGDLWLHFSFVMTFQHSGQAENATDFFRNKNILLAEDNELSALTFITLLEEWGCRVTKLSTALPPIEEIKCKRYHVVLINIHSPGRDGIDFIRRIRIVDQQLPIIGLASPWTKDYAADAYAAGVNDVLVKPVGTCELQKTLRKYI